MFQSDGDTVAELLILVGRNPLPNYVSALALGEPGRTAITLIYTRGSRDQRDVLLTLLGEQGFTLRESIEVEEANPTRIANALSALALPERAPVILDYTGGTKAMAVHAYRMLSRRAATGTQQRLGRLAFSYLDAHTLRLQLEGANGELLTRLSLGTEVQVSIDKLLRLHKLGTLKTQMHPEPVWPSVAATLLELYTSQRRAGHWRTFCQQLKDKGGSLLPADQLGGVTFGDLMQAAATVGAAFQVLYPQLEGSTPLSDLARLGGFASNDRDFAKWLDGSWLEHAVLASVKRQAAVFGVHEAVVTVNPLLPPVKGKHSDFEFDVCFVRGYQLFAVSCTTIPRRRDCKLKLLEAVVRAEQLGGAEARVGLVCYYEDPLDLESEVHELLGSKVKVFGRGAFANFDAELAEWVKTVSPMQP